MLQALWNKLEYLIFYTTLKSTHVFSLESPGQLIKVIWKLFFLTDWKKKRNQFNTFTRPKITEGLAQLHFTVIYKWLLSFSIWIVWGQDAWLILDGTFTASNTVVFQPIDVDHEPEEGSRIWGKLCWSDLIAVNYGSQITVPRPAILVLPGVCLAA